MARIPDAFIDDLLARTDIVEVIGARVPLKRQGKEYAARCPFHDERSAELHRVADQAVLPLLRLRRARHRDLVPDELRPPRVPRRGRGTRQARRHGSAARHARSATRTRDTQRPVRRARCRGEVLPQAAGRQRQGAGLPRRAAASTPTIAERFAHRLRARRLQRAARRARHRPAPHAAARARRPVLEERQAATSTTSSATG